jgi:creatinine amidohydrolase
LRLGGMTTRAVREYLSRKSMIVVPAGSTEQHGDLAPVDCDAAIACAICEAASDRAGVVCAPCLSFGMSENHLAFAGSVSFSPATLSSVIREIAGSLAGQGFRNFLFVSGHGGNRGPVLSGIASAAIDSPGCRLRYLGYWDLPGAEETQKRLFGPSNGYHATAAEISMYMHLFPPFTPDRAALKQYPPSPPPGSVLSAAEWMARYPEGPAGVDAREASAERGRVYFEFLVAGLAREISSWESGDS